MKLNELRHYFEKKAKDLMILSPVAPYIKLFLGARLHQKIYGLIRLGYLPNIRNPRTFNEKILHRKLYTSRQIFSRVEDKWCVREYVRENVGDDVLPEVYFMTEDPAEIPFENLPSEYVIKPTHYSGKVFIAEKDDFIDLDKLTKRLERWLESTYGIVKNEYWYKQIKPRILIEEKLKGFNSDIPADFKFFVFNGDVKYIQYDNNRQENHTRRFYDRNWKSLDVKHWCNKAEIIEEPENLDRMIEVAENLGKDFEFIRVDLYRTDEKRVMFGEMTVAHVSGQKRFIPQDFDFELGSYWLKGNKLN